MADRSFFLPAYTGATRGARCPSCGQAYRDDSEPNIPILLCCGHVSCLTCLEAAFTSQLASAPHTCRCPACAHPVYARLPHPEQVFWLRTEYHWEHMFMMVRIELSDEPRPEPQPQLAAPPPAAGLRLAIPFHPAPGSRELEVSPRERERALAFHTAAGGSAQTSAPATPTASGMLSAPALTPQQPLLPTQGGRRRARRRSRRM